MLNHLPRPILVFLILAAGIGLFFVIQEPHSVCNSQLVIFRESQQGQIFPRTTATSQRPALYPRLVENCKIGNSSGACYELFSLLKKLNQDLRGGPQECLKPFGQLTEVKRALKESTQLMIQLAWGERPPDAGLEKYNWFETPDLVLFCRLKDLNLKIYGEEEWVQLRQGTYNKLPGETQVFQDGICSNCEIIKKAPQVLSEEEIWVRSLFSLRCEQFL